MINPKFRIKLDIDNLEILLQVLEVLTKHFPRAKLVDKSRMADVVITDNAIYQPKNEQQHVILVAEKHIDNKVFFDIIKPSLKDLRLSLEFATLRLLLRNRTILEKAIRYIFKGK